MRTAITEIQSYYLHTLEAAPTSGASGASDAGDRPAGPQRRRIDLSEDTLRKIAEAMRRAPLLCKRARATPVSKTGLVGSSHGPVPPSHTRAR